MEIIVAKNGNDAWPGTLDRPVASLARARDILRSLKERDGLRGPATVLVRDGTYFLAEPFGLGPEDSGTKAGPVTYRAYGNEKPVISGGRKITGWKQAEVGLWKTQLPEVREGKWFFRQLFVNGRRCCRARLPEEGKFFFPAGAFSEDDGEIRNKTSFRFKPGDIKKWEHFEDAEVVYIHRFDISRMNIVAIDEKEGWVEFPAETLFPYGKQPTSRYWVENIKEGLTGPGTWFLDRYDGILFYRPRSGEDMQSAQVIAPVLEFLVRMEGNPETGKFLEHVSFSGLTFCHNDWVLPKTGFPSFQAAFEIPGALFAEGVRHCRIEGCEICQIGTYGIQLSRGCRENVIAENHLHDLGAGGVRIGEVGRFYSVAAHNKIVAARDAMVAGGNRNSEGVYRQNTHDQTRGANVCDNVIHDGGKVHTGAVGIWIGHAAENLVAHNEIYDLFYTGISVGWEWYNVPHGAYGNIIEYNHVHDVMKYTLCDGGGIYALGIQPGTIIRNNLIHDVYSYDPHSGRGIYLDACSSGIRIENNIIHHIRIAGIRLQIGTSGNFIRNNIIALCEEAPLGWDTDRSNCFMQNIVYFKTKNLFTRDKFDSYDSVIDFNLYFNPCHEINFLGYSFGEWKKLLSRERCGEPTTMDGHSMIADPCFVDAEKGDFRLKPESPAFALGFQPIETKNIGPRKKSFPPGTQTDRLPFE
jgi:parallel beta-helix repeat protein